MLRVNNLSFYYNKKKVLNSININFKSPGKYLIVGENGSGKTTLLNILTGFLKAKTGEILVDNISIDNTKSLSSLISYLPENYTLFNNYTLKEYLKIFNTKDKIFFNKLNLDLNSRYKFLSQAYKQRFLIYLSLADKKYIIIDDLLKFQDDNNNIINVIKDNFKSTTLIVSSPKIINEIKWTNIYILQDGVINVEKVEDVANSFV